MENYLKQLWEQVLEETKDERARINVYWDKKTSLVHRRALMIGFFLGAIEGAIVGVAISILYFIHAL